MGGVAEMRQSHPERVKIVLKNRKGFVKLALQTGTHLGKNIAIRVLTNF